MTIDTQPTPEQLREALVDRIRGLGAFRTPQVEQAFRTVPRHLFLPGVDMETAYAPKVVVTRRADDGTALSSASSPNVVARMLEQLDVQPGHRVLEIGTATGINAALLAELTGPAGAVTSIEIDPDLASGARAALHTAGYRQVEVIAGDGAVGHPARASYDRIIVTAGAFDISAAWWRQLAPGGRLVVPVRLHPSGLTRSIALDLDTTGPLATSRSVQVCGFVPMRGADAARIEHKIPLGEGVAVTIDADAADLIGELGQALTSPRHEHWTAITVADDDPVEHLDLWLATTLGSRFARLSADTAARDSGRAAPALRWAGAAVVDDGTLAYLTVRPVSPDREELGIVAHGPRANKLATRVADLLASWHRDRPTQPHITAWPTATPPKATPVGYRIDRPTTSFTISW
ncbi:methyltransferase, FxLD system [Actinomadura napierensis]|uniref:Protein-L-isoaspartate O-methyltransferase n=1 Tax=Actinomadura napierensis TaxID=267854 RepID=A0ABN2ZW63_9ACTN